MGRLDFHAGREYWSVKKYSGFSEENWRNPEWQNMCAITDARELAQVITLTPKQVTHINEAIKKTRPMRITPYYALLMAQDPLNLRDADGDVMPRIDPIFRQSVPTLAGAFFTRGNPDMGEADRSFGIAYGRYPDRIAFISTNMCEMYCTHCQRQTLITGHQQSPESSVDEAIDFIGLNKNIRDVLITGGDALTLRSPGQSWGDSELAYILKRFSGIPHLHHVRVCTRTPVTNPFIVTPELVNMLREYDRSPENPDNPKISVSIHVNHPHEITKEYYKSVDTFQRAGFLVRNQMVSINGVNDDYATMTETHLKLHALGVQPHYVLQGHEVTRLGEFLTPIPQTFEYFMYMRGLIPGPAIPKFIVNMEGGGGKVDLTPPGIREGLDAILFSQDKLPEGHPMYGKYSPYRYLRPWEAFGFTRRKAYAELLPMTQDEYDHMMGEMRGFYGQATGKYGGEDKLRPNVNLVKEIPEKAGVVKLYSPDNYLLTTNLRTHHLNVKEAEAIHGFNNAVFGAISNPHDAYRLIKINAALSAGDIIPGEDRKFLVHYLDHVGGIGGITAEKMQKFLVEDREKLIKQLIQERKIKGIPADWKKRFTHDKLQKAYLSSLEEVALDDLKHNVQRRELRDLWQKFLAENREDYTVPFETVNLSPPQPVKHTTKLTKTRL